MISDAPEADPALLLAEGARELDLELSPGQLERLLALARLLERWSRRMNLTGHRSLEAIVGRLVLDALALSTRLPRLASLADLGSGAGFPGLPLAILWPDCAFTLVEARARRHHFQREARRELELANVELLLGRVEVLSPQPRAGVVAQALASPARALRWMRPWVEPHGYLLLPGAEQPPEVPEIAGIRFERLERYPVPAGGPARTLWIGRAA